MTIWVVLVTRYNNDGGVDVDIAGLFTKREDAVTHANECPWGADVEEYELNRQYVPWWFSRNEPPDTDARD